MSLATLKRKTAAKYNNSSVGHANFSLNGTHRSQGYVGQNLRSESCMLCTNDTAVIKSSVGGSSNHIQARHSTTTRPGANTVKPDSNHIQNSQHTYIEQERKKAIIGCLEPDTTTPIVRAPCDIAIFNRKSINPVPCANTVKDLSGESKSSSSYIFKLANDCADGGTFMRSIGGTPLPGTF
jgi:hypothetical protein